MALPDNNSLPARAGAPSLTTIPLELRHQIFSYVSERPEGPEKLLRKWFERQEIDQIIASRRAAQGNPTEDDDEDDDNDDGEHDEDDDEDMEDSEDDQDTQTRVEASTKWRHITSIMRVSRCPPPTSLLLTCKSIHEEAMNWYYDVATLKLNASAGYAHTTFFEEALQQMANAPFSPIENIRRCEVKIFYDSDFISTESQAIPSIFQAMLRIRAELVIELLCQAPGLKYLKLKWYDSSTTPEAITFKRDILDQFDQLFAEITIEEHIIASGQWYVRFDEDRRRRLGLPAAMEYFLRKQRDLGLTYMVLYTGWFIRNYGELFPFLYDSPPLTLAIAFCLRVGNSGFNPGCIPSLKDL